MHAVNGIPLFFLSRWNTQRLQEQLVSSTWWLHHYLWCGHRMQCRKLQQLWQYITVYIYINLNVMRISQPLMLFICLNFFPTVCPLKNPLTSSMRSEWGGQSKRTSIHWTKSCNKNVNLRKKKIFVYHLMHTQFTKSCWKIMLLCPVQWQ